MLGVDMSCGRKQPFSARDKLNGNRVFRLSVDHIGLSSPCRGGKVIKSLMKLDHLKRDNVCLLLQ